MIGGGGIGGGIGGAIGGIAVLAGAAGKGGEKQFKEVVDIWRKLKDANFDFSKLAPAELQLVAQIIPEEFSAQVQGPAATTQDSPQVREAQLRNLSQLEQLGQTGLSLDDRLAGEEAQRRMAQSGTRYRQAALENMQARGRLGGGAELAAMQSGGQQQAELARGMGSDLMRQAQQNRLMALSQTGQLAGQLRGQDVDVSGQQANQRNLFNEWVSRLRTGVAGENAAMRQQAGAYNTQNRQRISDTNIQNRQSTAGRNQEYLNQLQQQGFQNRVTKTQGLTGALGDLGGLKELRRKEKAEGIQSIGQGVGSSLGGIGGLGF